jgi:hypothetical protein
MLKRKSFRGIDSSENLAQTSSGAVEIERDLVAVANQAMGADGEPMAVDLKTVAEPRLYDSSALADLGNQPVGIGNLLIVEASEVGSDDRAQQQATKAGRWIDWQHHVSEGNAACRHGGSRVEDLQFGEEHGER